MTVTAMEFLAQLEAAEATVEIGAPESPVEETSALMGPMEPSLIEENFEVAQNELQQEPEATLTTGFDLS